MTCPESRVRAYVLGPYAASASPRAAATVAAALGAPRLGVGGIQGDRDEHGPELVDPPGNAVASARRSSVTAASASAHAASTTASACCSAPGWVSEVGSLTTSVSSRTP
ncbi:hypothetical protein FGW37_00225 [Streptomyces rectiverticillatus]|uniref:hypothetical protein n=1 Tax=Streptomyces rectiverticillatus TaxID=173860 RepID=UPI0015C3A19E|nr:hypothetical protein [Streptomyces rectiverticillatus]QLE70248.1 hypothetical protein FGW37_00225 [Streptomyces rectiverticillatus]